MTLWLSSLWHVVCRHHATGIEMTAIDGVASIANVACSCGGSVRFLSTSGALGVELRLVESSCVLWEMQRHRAATPLPTARVRQRGRATGVSR